MDVSLLGNIGAAGATVVTSVFRILTTVIGFYQWHRKQLVPVDFRAAEA